MKDALRAAGMTIENANESAASSAPRMISVSSLAGADVDAVAAWLKESNESARAVAWAPPENFPFPDLLINRATQAWKRMPVLISKPSPDDAGACERAAKEIAEALSRPDEEFHAQKDEPSGASHAGSAAAEDGRAAQEVARVKESLDDVMSGGRDDDGP